MHRAFRGDTVPKLTILTNESVREVPFAPESSVRQVLDAAGLWVRSGCRGDGACGLCLVQVEAGHAPGPTRSERLLLSPETLARQTRLACQLRPHEDLTIRIVGTVPSFDWRDLPPEFLTCAPAHLDSVGDVRSPQAVHGVAVDLGTTHLSLTLWDLPRGARLCGRVGLNPQSYFGVDVVTRLMAAAESPDTVPDRPDRLDRRARCPDQHVCGCVDQSGRRDPPCRRRQHAHAGALDRGRSPDLSAPDAWTHPVACPLQEPSTWTSLLGIHPRARVDVVAPLAGFVGSDLIAGVLATDLTARPGSLLIDFGTNSEVALWDGQPALGHVRRGGTGLRGRTGPVRHAGRARRHPPDRHRAGCRRIALPRDRWGRTCRGLCGSGLVDLIAYLRRTGDVDSHRPIRGRPSQESIELPGTGPSLRLSRVDVDMFQRAKAAVGAGVRSCWRRRTWAQRH